MSSSKKSPRTNIGRNESMLKAKTKKDSVSPEDNILSDKTSSNLDDALDDYTKANAAITAATVAESKAMAAAIPQRKLLTDMVGHIFSAINHNISFGSIPRSARAFYGLDVNNNRTPAYNTDVKLLKIVTDIIKGDKDRTDAGGMVITSPTIIQFAAVNTIARPIIIALSNTKTNLAKAKSDLRDLNSNTDDVLLHVSTEVEMEYSKLEASAKRAMCREWGVRYISIGTLSDVTGKCTDSETGLPLENVVIKIAGSGKKVVTDIAGDYVDSTTMYDDLELAATHPLYIIAEKAFTKENGVNVVVDIKMVKK